MKPDDVGTHLGGQVAYSALYKCIVIMFMCVLIQLLLLASYTYHSMKTSSVINNLTL